MNGASRPLRVGRIVALNMYPVYHRLEAASLPDVTFTDGLPAALNRAVVTGDLDMSAMSSIEFARHADLLQLLPIGSITAAGAVDSIQVFSRVPFDQMRSVAVTSHSATSVALLRVLVGPDVVFSPLRASVGEALDGVDGVLLIADEALAEMQRPSAPFATDLGAQWRERTGLPMVFGVWAVRRQVALERPEQLTRVCGVIRQASQPHTQDFASVVSAAASRFPFPEDFIRHYFTRLSYDFGTSERASLTRFFELAHQAGEVAAVPALPD